MAGCLIKDGKVADSHKLGGLSKAQCQDHVPKSHTLDAHLVPTGSLNMGGFRLKNLANPTANQDIATKAYVDGIEEPTPADRPMIAWPEGLFGNETDMKTRYQIYKDMGINCMMYDHHQEDYRDDSAAMAKYDQIYTLAAEYGLKVIFYVDNRATFANPNNSQKFVERYKDFPACGGWMLADEPHCWHDWGGEGDWPAGGHGQALMLYEKVRNQDPDIANHPAFAVWEKGFAYPCEGYDKPWTNLYTTIYTPGGEIFDIGSVDIYPNGNNWEFLDYWIDYSYEFINEDGFGELGKGMIPVIDAWTGGAADALEEDGHCNLVNQCIRWENKYTRAMIKGIGFFNVPNWMASTPKGENLRGQIKDVCRYYGWSG